MTQPRQAQLDLLLSISEGLSRGSYEMLRVSPTDAMHAPSCGLAIRDAVEELRWMRAEIERLRAKIKWLIEDDERLHYVLYRIANPPPFADCPVEMAQNATRGEHLRREAFDGIRRALEGKP